MNQNFVVELLLDLIMYLVFTSTVLSKVTPKPRYSSESEIRLVSVEKVVQGRGQSDGVVPSKRRWRRAKIDFYNNHI